MSTPFLNKQFTFKNPDGRDLVVKGHGDAHYAIFETADGFTVMQDPASGSWHYAKLSDDSRTLVPSGVQAGTVDPRTLGLVPHLRPASGGLRAASMAARAASGPLATKPRWKIRRENKRAEAQRMLPTAGQPAPPQHTRTGTYTGMCLLIRFPDVAGTITQQEVSDFCNKAGYSGNGNNGSVYDYYLENSRGLLKYTNAVSNYYTAKKPRQYYTDPSVTYGLRAQELIQEALSDLKAKGFNFNQLSSDESGYVFALNVFYAGDVVNNWAQGLWPHSSSLATPFTGAPGKTFADYQITDMGTALTLHTFCHENGHMLCDFPDLYDYGYESYGDGNYCLMAYGGPDSKNPVKISAYLKRAAGWASKVTAITGPMSATVRADQNEFYIYANPRKGTEYFLLENRQKKGRDAALPCAGLAIWHIDELGSNNNQQMTAALHYELQLEQADGKSDLERDVNLGDADDLYRLPKFIRFADETSPAARWWDGTDSGLNIDVTSISGDSMTFSQRTAAITALQLCVARNADGRLETFSVGTNSRIYHIWQNVPNGGWNHAIELGGEAKQIVAQQNADGRLEVFYIGTNDNIYHNWQVKANGNWAGEAPLGGLAKQIAVGRNADGRLEVFYVGTNNHIYHNWQTVPNGGWHGEVALGGLAKQIAVGRNADGRLEVFYVGTNDHIYHNWQTVPNGGWHGESALGGLAKQIAVGRDADGRLEVFYVGTNNNIYHNWQTVPNGGWSGEAPLGGAAKQVAVANDADGRLEVFYVGTNDKLYHNWQTVPNGGWAGEAPLGGAARQVDVANDADGRLEVFYVGTNDHEYHNWQVTPNGGWSGESPL